eukprot:scaffold1590_cov417-Prasinococcus_capsulatus_cf.AAC.16
MAHNRHNPTPTPQMSRAYSEADWRKQAYVKRCGCRIESVELRGIAAAKEGRERRIDDGSITFLCQRSGVAT